MQAVEKLNLDAAYQQSVRDADAAGRGEYPIVIHKKSRRPVMVTMSLEDWIVMYLVWIQDRGEKKKNVESKL